MNTLLTLLCLVPLSLGSVVPDQGLTSRDEKFLSVFEIVKFNNEMCSASDGNMGVCYTEKECTSKGGIATGTCAAEYGVCCVFKTSECGSTVSEGVTYIESPNYPAAAPSGMCMFNVAKCDPGVCQYKIDFDMVMLDGPSEGECGNDTLSITNLDTVSAAVVPNPLCGTLTGQSIYVTVNDTTVDPKFNFNIDSSNAKWRIKVEQILCTQLDMLAPPGCLTYDTETSGTFMSFNNQGGFGQLINNQKYSHCIKYQPGFCNIAFQSDDFKLGADDMINFGTSTYTGDSFGTSGSLQYNFTGPYVFPVMSGADNTELDTGYSINYLLLPC